MGTSARSRVNTKLRIWRALRARGGRPRFAWQAGDTRRTARAWAWRGKEAAMSLGQGYQHFAQSSACGGNRSAARTEACAGGRPALVRCGNAGASGEHESMKSRETLIRLKKFQVDERRRRVAQIESMISEFERISSDLERDIKIEQDRSGIHDPGHFAYPTYA